jgi:hypothetical protein
MDRPQSKTENEVEFLCNKPTQQFKSIKTNILGFIREFHVVKQNCAYRQRSQWNKNLTSGTKIL